MSLSTVTVMYDSPLLRVTDIACRHPRGGCGCERGGERTHLTMLRRSGFGYHVNGRMLIGDPTMALLYRAGDSYRISHPFEGGDECTTFEIAIEHEGEVFGRRLREHHDLQRAVSAANQFAHLQLHRWLRLGSRDPLVVEEAAAQLCESVLRQRAPAECCPQLSTSAMVLVRQVREALLADPVDSAGLDGLAARAGCSPFHLARSFRKATGFSLVDYRTQLRIALSLERLAQGQNDLSALAQDMGFSHHSHFSAAFRRRVGMTPSAVRASMRAPAMIRLGRNLIARCVGRR
ncbi:MAG: AraC family transcriptional regulator [Rhodanobacter sp.]